MKFVISPSKTQDFSQAFPEDSLQSSVVFPEQSLDLVARMKHYSKDDLMSLMRVSEKIALLNVDRFSSFSSSYTPENSLPAIFAYKGDVYDGFDIESLPSSSYALLQSKMRILSGLYGIMRPFDMMQAYRLEMGTSLKSKEGFSLYEFWSTDIADFIAEEESELLVNLASEEYWKSVDQSRISAKIISIVFKEKKDDAYKVIGIHAKKARGMMARFIIDTEAETLDDLKKFTAAGYSYSADLSDESSLVFIR